MERAQILAKGPCIEVEWDPNYYGGNSSGSGGFVYIPRSLIAADTDEGVEEAFGQFVLEDPDPRHIIHYDLYSDYTIEGEDWEGFLQGPRPLCKICGGEEGQWMWLPLGAHGKMPRTFCLPEQQIFIGYSCKAIIESGRGTLTFSLAGSDCSYRDGVFTQGNIVIGSSN